MQNLNPNNHTEQKWTNVLYPALNIAAVACLSLLFLIGISNVGGTVSYFSSAEKSLGNFFTADPLYFSTVLATSTIEMSAGETLVVPVMVPGEKSEPAQYYARASALNGDPTLCNAINVLATAPFPYDGPLAGLQTATTTETGPWALTLYLAPGSAPVAGSACTIDLIYTGWNAGVAWGSGYSDIQHVPLTFTYNPAPVPATQGSAPVAVDPDTASTTPVTSSSDAAPEATSTDGDINATLPSPTSSDTSLPANDPTMPPTTPDVGTPAQTPPVEVPPVSPAPQPPTDPVAQQ